MPARSAVLVSLACLGACAGTPPTTTTAPAAVPESAGAEPAVEAPAPAAPACVALEPAGPPPSILVTTWPEVHHPPRYDARGRRVILLDGLDAYGPLRVARIDPAGTTTDLGEGSDPRFFDGGVLYVEGIGSDDGHTTLVRILPDGTTERRPGGTGLLPGLGGPLPRWLSPFTRDGRFMAFADGCDEAESGCALVVYDHFPSFHGEDAPLERIELVPPRRPSQIFLSEDARVIAACTRDDGAEAGTLVWIDRARGERTTAPIAGRCAALSPTGDRILASEYDAERGLEVARPATGERTRLETGLRVAAAAFDACGTSVVVVGAVPDTDAQRALRLFLDGRAPQVLLESTGGAELAHVEIDERGWVLVASDEPGDAAHAFVVSLAGGAAAEWTVPGRVFDVALGP